MQRGGKVQLVYDPQCPICDFYCRRLAPGDGGPAIELVDARQSSAVMGEITAQGLDIDEGMVLKVEDRLYYGAEAIHRLSLLSAPKGLVRPLAPLFKRRALAQRLYPLFKAMRSLVLKVMGKTRINNLGRLGNDRF